MSNTKKSFSIRTDLALEACEMLKAKEETIVDGVKSVTKNKDGKCIHEVASQEWLDHYMKTRMAPLEEK